MKLEDDKINEMASNLIKQKIVEEKESLKKSELQIVKGCLLLILLFIGMNAQIVMLQAQKSK